MMRDNPEGVRLTHGPTGLVARSLDCAPRRQKWGWYHRAALGMLRAKLAGHLGLTEPPGPPIRRVYDLCPPLGIAPNVRQGPGGSQWLASGRDEVVAILDGRIDAMLARAMRGESIDPCPPPAVQGYAFRAPPLAPRSSRGDCRAE